MMRKTPRALNDSGVERFRAYLAELRRGATAAPPLELLEDVGATRELPVDVTVELRPFSARLGVGMYLHERLAPIGVEDVDADPGLWAWLSLFFFDEVCPARSDGTRRPGQDYRHVPSFDFRTTHRHLLYGPYQVYRRHGQAAALLLTGPPSAESGVYHEIAGRQDLIANRGVIEAATLLYYDAERRAPRPGAQGPATRPGTVRRFIRVLQQLDMTYDLYALSGDQLLELLPPEFDAWRPAPDPELPFDPPRRGAPAHEPTRPGGPRPPDAAQPGGASARDAVQPAPERGPSPAGE